VILLDNRIVDQVSTRRLRILKYRGSSHGPTNTPSSSAPRAVGAADHLLRLDHQVERKRVSTGIAGWTRCSAARASTRQQRAGVRRARHGQEQRRREFVPALLRRGERALLFAYEESESQLLRNMRSIGIDMQPAVEKGLLQIHASRPTLHGLEQHLVHIYDLVHKFRPAVVVVDPISNLSSHLDDVGLKLTLMRLIDFLKQAGVTAMFTSLTVDSAAAVAASEVGVSSLMDSWLLLANLAYNGERTRTLQVLKSRGMAHSNQVREFVFSDHGVDWWMSIFRRRVSDRHGAHRAGSPGTGRHRPANAGPRPSPARPRQPPQGAGRADRGALREAEERAGDVRYRIAREKFEAEGATTRSREIARSRSTHARWTTNDEGRAMSAAARSASKAARSEAEWQLRLYVAGRRPARPPPWRT
jgi:circadian clock protein KaiC